VSDLQRDRYIVSYRVGCYRCAEEYDATTARWCHCLSRDRSKVCPCCRRCFCEASAAYKSRFWKSAPEALWLDRAEQREAPEQITPVLKKPLVLLVDDDPAIRAVGWELITRFGYGCLTASGAKSAYRLARRYHPDLVLTDALMPGMDGRELSRKIKSDPDLAPVRVVLMTSVYRGQDYAGEAATEFGVDAYLEKPVSIDMLREILEELLPGEDESHANLSPSLDDLEDFADSIGLEGDPLTIID
jgi:CheY-like chemotaxis protein